MNKVFLALAGSSLAAAVALGLYTVDQGGELADVRQGLERTGDELANVREEAQLAEETARGEQRQLGVELDLARDELQRQTDDAVAELQGLIDTFNDNVDVANDNTDMLNDLAGRVDAIDGDLAALESSHERLLDILAGY